MRLKKAMVVFGTVCILNTMVTGCGSGSESAAKTEENQISEVLSEESMMQQKRFMGTRRSHRKIQKANGRF